MEELKRLMNIEYEKWSNLPYEELLKPTDIGSGHHYIIDTPEGEVNVVVTLLENKPEYLHPMIEIQGIPKMKQTDKWWRRWSHDIDEFSHDWIVYKDGRIDK